MSEAQCLSTVHFSFLPQRLGHLLARSSAFRHKVRALEMRRFLVILYLFFKLWGIKTHPLSRSITSHPLHLPHQPFWQTVIITCTLPPLPSRWSRSPGSCPCCPPAPGHSQRSLCRHSHTSHPQGPLTPPGRGVLQARHEHRASAKVFVFDLLNNFANNLSVKEFNIVSTDNFPSNSHATFFCSSHYSFFIYAL